MIRKIIYLGVLLFLFINVFHPTSTYAAEPDESWEEHKDTHFIIKYDPDIPSKYIREFSRKCERYYSLIADRLGFNRFDFWLWDDRARVFVYKSKEDYLEDTSRPAWSGGSVEVKTKTINTFYGRKDFFETTLPHEMAHIILREFIGDKVDTPLWFDEGVACANEDNSYLKYLLVAKGFMSKGFAMKISEMEMINSGDELIVPLIFYSTAASLVIYLLEEYNIKDFSRFCTELKEKRDFYKAMKKVYHIKNADDLDEKFTAFLKRKTYREIEATKDYNVEW